VAEPSKDRADGAFRVVGQDDQARSFRVTSAWGLPLLTFPDRLPGEALPPREEGLVGGTDSKSLRIKRFRGKHTLGSRF